MLPKHLQTLVKLVSVEMGGKEGPTFTLEQEETTCGRSQGDILFYKDNFERSKTWKTFSQTTSINYGFYIHF